MLYLANPSTSQAREEMSQGVIGCIVTPAQGNRLPGGSLWCADNGCGPGKSGQPGNNDLSGREAIRQGVITIELCCQSIC